GGVGDRVGRWRGKRGGGLQGGGGRGHGVGLLCGGGGVAGGGVQDAHDQAGTGFGAKRGRFAGGEFTSVRHGVHLFHRQGWHEHGDALCLTGSGPGLVRIVVHHTDLFLRYPPEGKEDFMQGRGGQIAPLGGAV